MNGYAKIGRRGLIASAAALSGCNTVLQRPKYVQRTTWPLSLNPPASLAAYARKHPHKTLLVQEFTAAPGLDQQGVHWLNANGSVHIDFYNTWEVLPAQAVSDDARRWLIASGLFAAVVGPGSTLAADLMLEGELTHLVADPSTLRAHAALSITLLNQRTTPAKSLLQTVLSADAAVPRPTPDGVVAGERAALANVLDRLVHTLRRFA